MLRSFLFDVEPHPLWPPRNGPTYGGMFPIDPGFTDPSPYDHGKLINPKPDISRLPPIEAATLLTGNGYEVVETLDLDDASDPFEALNELGLKGETTLGREMPEPGDKVIMLSSEGKAVDFVVVEKGSGKLPFETKAETAARVEKIVAELDFTKAGAGTRAAPIGRTDATAVDLGALEGKLEELQAERNKTETDLVKLNEIRDTLSADVGGLESQLSAAAELRSALAADVEKSRVELQEISALKEASLSDISTANEELVAVRKDHQEFVVTMRREQPIESILGRDTAAIQALKARGIVSVGDIENANTRTLTSTLNNSSLNGTQAKNLATNFVNRT